MPRGIPITIRQQREMRELAALNWPASRIALAMDLHERAVRDHAPDVGMRRDRMADRPAEAHRLHGTGLTWKRIALRLGYSSEISARVSVHMWRKSRGLQPAPKMYRR